MVPIIYLNIDLGLLSPLLSPQFWYFILCIVSVHMRFEAAEVTDNSTAVLAGERFMLISYHVGKCSTYLDSISAWFPGLSQNGRSEWVDLKVWIRGLGQKGRSERVDRSETTKREDSNLSVVLIDIVFQSIRKLYCRYLAYVNHFFNIALWRISTW